MLSKQTEDELRRLVEVVFNNSKLFEEHFFAPFGYEYSLQEFRVSVSSCEFKFIIDNNNNLVYEEYLTLDNVIDILEENGVNL